jgi:hypothetical protein
MVGEIRPFGTLYREERPTFESQVHAAAQSTRGIEEVFALGRTWTVE